MCDMNTVESMFMQVAADFKTIAWIIRRLRGKTRNCNKGCKTGWNIAKVKRKFRKKSLSLNKSTTKKFKGTVESEIKINI